MPTVVANWTAIEKILQGKLWSLSKLSEESSLSPRTITRIKNREPINIATLTHLAEALDADAKILVQEFGNQSAESASIEGNSAQSPSGGRVDSLPFVLRIDKELGAYPPEEKERLLRVVEDLLSSSQDVKIVKGKTT